MNWIHRNAILGIVFLTGAAVLIVEVAATRILAPWFGNTIYTFSSVISVILAALSFGYYLGGILADRRPLPCIFHSLIVAAGLSVYLCQTLAIWLLPAIANSLSITTGPLLLATVLYLVPGIILGTLSPFAIKLQSARNPETGIATISGKVFFWSTLGSIAGSLSAGFLLIPHLGLNTIMLSTASLLVLLGIAGLALDSRPRIAVTALIITLITGGLSIALARPHPTPGTRFETNGLYENIAIRDVAIDGRPARILQQDRTVSGLVYLDNGDLLPYVRFPIVTQLLKPDIRRVLAIGGGSYLLPRTALENFPTATIDVAEVEPQLYPLAQKYFNVAPDSRLHNHIADGRRFLHDSPANYDLIFTDVYQGMTIPSHFTTREYYQLVKSKLSTGGVYMANLLGDQNPNPPNLLYSQIRLIREVFPNSEFFTTEDSTTTEAQSIVAVAINGPQPFPFDSPAIAASRDPVIRDLPRHRLSLEGLDWSRYALLTDDYAPAEYFAMHTLRRELNAR